MKRTARRLDRSHRGATSELALPSAVNEPSSPAALIAATQNYAPSWNRSAVDTCRTVKTHPYPAELIYTVER